MSEIQLRPAAECHYDMVSLGEVMLRLDRERDGSHGALVSCLGRRRRVQCRARVATLF